MSDTEERALQRKLEAGDAIAGIRLHDLRKRRGDEQLPVHEWYVAKWMWWRYTMRASDTVGWECMVTVTKHRRLMRGNIILESFDVKLRFKIPLEARPLMSQEEFTNRYLGRTF